MELPSQLTKQMSFTTPPSIAPLRNVRACLKLADTLIKRDPNLPGIGVMFGYSGLGKSFAGNYVRSATQAHLIEVRDYWTRKSLVENLLRALHVRDPKGTLSQMMDQAIRILGDDPTRPLIIDEADKLIDKNMIELVRDLHEMSGAPVMLLGEENLPAKLRKSERTHNRVLAWVIAEPCDVEDARALAKLHCREAVIGDDLLAKIVAETHGTARRVATSLNAISLFAKNSGLKQINISNYSGPIANGQVPTRQSGARQTSAQRRAA